jgi:hypothetical protein
VPEDVKFEDMTEDQQIMVRWWIATRTPLWHRNSANQIWCVTQLWERHPLPSLCYQLKK